MLEDTLCKGLCACCTKRAEEMRARGSRRIGLCGLSNKALNAIENVLCDRNVALDGRPIEWLRVEEVSQLHYRDFQTARYVGTRTIGEIRSALVRCGFDLKNAPQMVPFYEDVEVESKVTNLERGMLDIDRQMTKIIRLIRDLAQCTRGAPSTEEIDQHELA